MSTPAPTRIPEPLPGAGRLVGCSWLFEPSSRRPGAEAMTPVRAYESDAEGVRTLMDADAAFGSAWATGRGRSSPTGCRPPACAFPTCTRPTAAAASSDRPHGEGAGHARIPLHRQ